MSKFHIRDYFDKYRPHPNLIFWIAMMEEAQEIIPTNKDRKIIDFGCGDGSFFHLFPLMDSFKSGVGIEIEESLLKQAKEKNIDDVEFIKYSDDFFKQNKSSFDIVFSQEVIYTIEDLKKHAQEIFDILKPDAYYFATMGSHIQNPLWSKRRKIIRDEFQAGICNYNAYDYSLDEVAEIFSSVGFEVGLKRLPLKYFMVYNQKLTKEFSNSLYDLVKTSEEEKMLFLFWKPSE